MRWRLWCRWKPSLISSTLLSLGRPSRPFSYCISFLQSKHPHAYTPTHPPTHTYTHTHPHATTHINIYIHIHTDTHWHTRTHTHTTKSINRPNIRPLDSNQIKGKSRDLKSEWEFSITASATVNGMKGVNWWLTFDRFWMALLSPRHSREETPCPLTTTCERLLKMQHSGPYQLTLTASTIVHTAHRTVLYGLSYIHWHFLHSCPPINSAVSINLGHKNWPS